MWPAVSRVHRGQWLPVDAKNRSKRSESVGRGRGCGKEQQLSEGDWWKAMGGGSPQRGWERRLKVMDH